MFGVGALLTVASFMVAYISQLEYANCRFASDYADETGKKRHHRRHVATSYIAIGLFLFALIAGGYGMFTAFIEARRH
jgi:small-conductance mechanosensitive channel